MLTQGEDVEVHALARRGWSISAIARHLGRDRKTVRAYVAGERQPGVRRKAAPDPLEPFIGYLAARFVDDRHLWLSSILDRRRRRSQAPRTGIRARHRGVSILDRRRRRSQGKIDGTLTEVCEFQSSTGAVAGRKPERAVFRRRWPSFNPRPAPSPVARQRRAVGVEDGRGFNPRPAPSPVARRTTLI